MTARILAVVFGLSPALPAASVFPPAITLSEVGLGLAIPDNDPAGLARSLTLADTLQWTLGYSISVSLEILPVGAAAFTGDYYAYLSHTTESGDDSLLAILLNRAGRSEDLPFGYADAGFQIILADSAPADVHTYRLPAAGGAETPLSDIPPFDGILSGYWQPSARAENPYTVFESSPRNAFLAPLGMLDPNGTWTLFTADLDAGGEGMLNSWSVTLTPIPEPSAAVLLVLASLLHTFRSRQHSAGET